MLHNYLKIALRHLVRQPLLSILNIGGLALGIAVFTLMCWHVISELSFDKYHSLHQNIYRLALDVEGASYENGIAKIGGNYAALIKEDVPEVLQTTRFVRHGEVLMARGEQRAYETGGIYADSTTFQLFDFPLVNGDRASLLSSPNAIVITKSLATRYFGDEDPMGKTLSLNGDTEMRVTGLMDDIPAHSHFRFDFLVSMSSWRHPQHDTPTWWQYYTYLLLPNSADPDLVAAKCKEVLLQKLGDDASNYRPFLQPLTDIHLKSALHREIAPNSSMTQLWIFGTSAFFILLIACINFINLTTAFAARRAREVGVRKTTGAYQEQLAGQFITEALVTTGIAVLIASQIV
jgi:putative ABC transport system permease protein